MYSSDQINNKTRYRLNVYTSQEVYKSWVRMWTRHVVHDDYDKRVEQNWAFEVCEIFESLPVINSVCWNLINSNTELTSCFYPSMKHDPIVGEQNNSL